MTVMMVKSGVARPRLPTLVYLATSFFRPNHTDPRWPARDCPNGSYYVDHRPIFDNNSMH